MNKSIGALEFISISRGMYVADAIVKKAEVEIIYFRTICPGKFLIIVSGDEGEVDTAIDYGVSIGGKTLFDSFKVHAVSPAIVEGIRGKYEPVEKLDAVGIVETRKVCTGIKALDNVLKAADVKVFRIYLAFAIGGKFVFAVMGSVSSIEHGVLECKPLLSEDEWGNVAIIPSPNRDILENLLKR
jgi:PduT-like ethanolamine utilization protein